MTIKQMTCRLQTFGDKYEAFGGIEAIYELTVWESDDNELLVRVGKDGNLPYAEKKFKDCETQHSDSERWLNDTVGYPNPFAGILLMRGWE